LRCSTTRPCARGKAAVLLLAALVAPSAFADGLMDALVTRFAQSDFVFPRVNSDVPFVPLAWASTSYYNDATFTQPASNSTTDVGYRQSSFTEAAIVPVPVGRRDALVVGEWVNVTQFRLLSGDRNLNVTSVSLPVGWARQVQHDWQVAAFVAPLGHTSAGDGWYWETLAGAFARYTRNERLAWIFGAYMDKAPLESFYTPYVGATWVLNQHWSLGLVLPWPGINYSPNPDAMFRLGIAPSSASWSVEGANEQTGGTHPRINFDSYNLGLDAEHRVYRNFWVGIEAGWSGLRGLTVVGGQYESLSTRMSGTAYVLLTVNFRPPSSLTD
jgi:hypothetical protein